jgi:hypothetical protein
MVVELPPWLLLPLRIGERGRIASDLLYLGRVAGVGK